jgi:hypothetical protein
MNRFECESSTTTTTTITATTTTTTITTNNSDNDNVKVYVRVRPPNAYEISTHSKTCAFVKDNNTIILDSKPPKIFTFDYVADSHVTQVLFYSLLHLS